MDFEAVDRFFADHAHKDFSEVTKDAAIPKWRGNEEEWKEYQNYVHVKNNIHTTTSPYEELINKPDTKLYRKGILHTLLSFFLVAIAGIGYYLADTVPAFLMEIDTYHVTNMRPCVAENKDLKITGRREYHSQHRDILGYTLQDKSTLSIKTIIDVPMDGISATMLRGNDYDVLTRGKAEGGVLILKEAQTYIFHVNGKVLAVNSEAFCK